MRYKYVLLICTVATLAGAQAYSGNGLPPTPILPSSSPLIATPVIASSPVAGGASNDTADNMVGATNATAGNIAGASNATGDNIAGASNSTGNNIAGASNSTLTMVPGAGNTMTGISPYAEIPPSAALGSQWQTAEQQELSPQAPVYLELGATRSDSAYDGFGTDPVTLAEASRWAKTRSPHEVRVYTNADIERMQQGSGVRAPAAEAHPDASKLP